MGEEVDMTAHDGKEYVSRFRDGHIAGTAGSS